MISKNRFGKNLKACTKKPFDRYANEDEAITDEINEYIKAKFQLSESAFLGDSYYKEIIDRAGVTTPHR